MSLRLPTGHRLRVTDTAQLQGRLDTFRERARGYARKRANEALGRELARRYDLAMTDPDAPGASEGLLSQLVDELMGAWDSGDHDRLPDGFQLACTLTIHPDPQAPGDVYLLVHAQHRDAYVGVLRSLPGVTPFAIDTRSGPPAGIGAADWTHRQAVWERLLAPRWIPAEAGLSFTAIGRVLPLDLDPGTIDRNLPDLETRIRASARELAVRRHLRRLQDAGEIPEKGPAVMQATMSYITSEAYPADADRIAVEIAGRLDSGLCYARLDRPAPGHGRRPD